MLQEIARTIPNDTWLTAFQGTSAIDDQARRASASFTPSDADDRRRARPTTTTTTATGDAARQRRPTRDDGAADGGHAVDGRSAP